MAYIPSSHIHIGGYRRENPGCTQERDYSHYRALCSPTKRTVWDQHQHQRSVCGPPDISGFRSLLWASITRWYFSEIPHCLVYAFVFVRKGMEWQSIHASNSYSLWLTKSGFLAIPCLPCSPVLSYITLLPLSLSCDSKGATSGSWMALFYSPVVYTQAFSNTVGTQGCSVLRQLSDLALEPLERVELVSCLPLSPSLPHPHCSPYQTQEATWSVKTRAKKKCLDNTYANYY